MSNMTVNFGSRREPAQLTVAQGFEVFFDDDILNDIQAFLDHVPELNPEEGFYFGLWRMAVLQIDGRYHLCEWNFESDKFDSQISRSICLWHAQRAVVSSQGLPWTSIGINDWVHFTPSVFSYQQESTIEGARDVANVGNGSGWLLYSASDRQNNLPFECIRLDDALKTFNVNILRFLCLPDGWMFNIEKNGISHVWQEELSDPPIN